MNLSLILIAIGIFNSIAFFLVILFSRKGLRANRFLAFLVLALGFNLAISWVIESGYFDLYPLLHLLPFGISFGLGPLYYGYVSTLINEGSYPKRNLFWLLADYPHSVFHLIYGRQLSPEGLHEVVDKFGALSIAVMIFYLVKSSRLIKQYRAELPDKLSDLSEQRLNWLSQITGIFLFSIVIILVFWILLFTLDLTFDDRIVAYLSFNVFIFWLGSGGIQQQEIIASLNEDANKQLAGRPLNRAHVERLIKAMEEDKLFLIPGLNVRYLEDTLGINAKEISTALNDGLGKNFYMFINEYRVAEFKKRVHLETNLTLAGLAQQCGFSSKTTFQRVFKELTGQTPADFVSKQVPKQAMERF